MLRRARDEGRAKADALDLIESWWGEAAIIEIDAGLLREAGTLVDRHRLRAYDAVHLASALILPPPVRFACFDARLRDAAAAEGLTPVP